MSEVRFYHLTRTTLEAVLPRMLERTLSRGQRAIVRVSSEERAEALCAHLWTYHDRSFLPHGTSKDGSAEDQPIWLTAKDAVPNGAGVLFLCDGADSDSLEDFELCAVLFDGRDEDAVARARAQWARYKQASHALTYWQQEPGGGWTEKAKG